MPTLARRVMIATDSRGDLAGHALAYAARGWPVFPCLPGRKVPHTEHGCLDAITDLAAIRAWWSQHPHDNVAIATGYPAVDVLDVDVKPDGNGFAAYTRLKRAGLLTGASALVRTRSGGLHVYFAGTAQRCSKLPMHHLDFKAAGGYVIAPPSFVEADERGPAGNYELIGQRESTATIDWPSVHRLLEPPRFTQPTRRPGTRAATMDGIVRYLSGLKDGDQRWRQLYWGACRAAGLIAAGKLDEATARGALMEAARANGFIADHGERQALQKIDRGLRDGAQ